MGLEMRHEARQVPSWLIFDVGQKTMRLIPKLRDLTGSREDDPRDALASLLLAAKEDEVFRCEVLFLLRAPSLQRQSLVNTALHEMALRGEPEKVRAAFALLASDEGAKVAMDVLKSR